MKETTLSQVKVGDLIWDHSDFPAKRSFPRLVTRITDSTVFSRGYRLPSEYNLLNDPELLKDLGLKGLKIHGDNWDGGASFPIQGNEHLLEFGVERKEKKTSQFRGRVREVLAYTLTQREARIEYDFYVG